MTDASGEVTDSYAYDAWGVLLSSTSVGAPTFNRYLFAGEPYDGALGLYHLRDREMNSETGRFWTMDRHEGTATEPASLHKYLYAQADPVNAADPTGRFSISQVAMTGGVVGILAMIAVPTMKPAQEMMGGTVDEGEKAIREAFFAELQAMEKSGERREGLGWWSGAANNLLVLFKGYEGCGGQSLLMWNRMGFKKQFRAWRFERRATDPPDSWKFVGGYNVVPGFHWVVKATDPYGKTYMLDSQGGVFGPWGQSDQRFPYTPDK